MKEITPLLVDYSLDIFAPSTKQRFNDEEPVQIQEKEPEKEKEKKKRKTIQDEMRIMTEDPIDFYCNNYDTIIKDIKNNFIDVFGNKLNDPAARNQIMYDGQNIINSTFELHKVIPSQRNYKEYINTIYNDLFGLGMLQPLLDDDSVTEIMVVQHDKIFIEKNGTPQYSRYRFPNYENALGVVTKIIEPLNKKLTFSSPNVDAQLPDGSRLSASIPPMKADNDISITIRKFPKYVERLEFYSKKYKNQDMLMVEFMERCVEVKANIIVSGGTGSGKTTLLNGLSFSIPARDRILTCEDTKELKLQQEHVESYLTVDANVEGTGGVTMQDIIKAALRKRPDRIIVGECRGGEIVEMFNAMSTGHDGSLSTIHANNPEEMVSRATTMYLSNPQTSNLSQSAILMTMGAAINLIIQAQRLDDGSRRITEISEVTGYGEKGRKKLEERGIVITDPNNDRLFMTPIFKFVQTSKDEDDKIHGYFKSCGYKPYLLDKMHMNSITLSDESIFEKETILLEV